MIREEWLLACLNKLRPDFERAACPLPARVPRLLWLAVEERPCTSQTTNWRGVGGFLLRRRDIRIFISPVLKDAKEVLATLVHEGVHCAAGVEHQHKGPFRRAAKAVGLEGKPTATTAGEALQKRLAEICTEVGPYPHAELKSGNTPKKQGTRMRLVKCPDCGYQVRTTMKWLEVGVPTCPCGAEMQADEGGDEDSEAGDE